MNQYFVDFYHNWSNKANGIIGNSLAEVYDKYMTLFVIYNNLYNQIPTKLISKGIAVPDKIYDNNAATDFTIKLLGADEFMEELTSKNLDNDIQTIIDLIDQEIFHIKIRHGQYSRNDDLRILDELKSANNSKKAVAILKVLYYVRCNIFHGSKDFQEYQRLLVEPLIRIIEIINPFLYAKLNEN